MLASDRVGPARTVPLWRQNNIRLLVLMVTSRWVINGFANVALLVILRNAGATLPQLSLMLAVGFLELFKFLWAPFVDKFRFLGSHYRSWFLVTQVLQLLPLAMLALLRPVGDFYLVYSCLVVGSFVATFRDIAMDGLIVKLLPEDERAAASGYMSACVALGLVIGGGLILVFYDRIGWSGSVGILIAALLLPIPFVWVFREPDVRQTAADSPLLSMVTQFFKEPGYKLWTLMLLLLACVGAIESSILSVILVDLKWSLSEIGFVSNIVAPLAAVVVSVLAGQLFSTMRRRPSLLVACLFVAATGALLIPLSKGVYGFAAYGVVVLVSMASVTLNVAGKMAIIDKCAAAPSHAATYFTIQASIGQVGAIGLGALAPLLADSFGYPVTMGISVAVSLTAALALTRYRGL